MSDAAAMEIQQRLLDRTGRAMLSGDPTDFLPCFLLPQLIRTFVGARRLETMDDLREVFFACHHHFRQIALTDLIRIPLTARFTAPDRIEATHETHLLAGTLRLSDPYPVFTVLCRTGANWQIAGAEYAVAPGSAHDRALTSAGQPAAMTGPAVARLPDAEA